jgi:hypothetical protein
MPVSTNPFSTPDIAGLPAFGPRENNDIMFIESEVTLLSVNNVNTTDPHFNMLGKYQCEHHKIIISVCFGRNKQYFPSIPMEMKGFRNDTG